MKYEIGKFKALMLAAALFFSPTAVLAGSVTGGYFPGLPVVTLPLTGNEQGAFDTNLTGGLAPQTELISTGQLQYGNSVQFTTATNTSAFTMTVAQFEGAPLTVLSLTGTLGAGAVLTTPTATAILAALPSAGFVNESYILRIINNSSANFAWTVTAGSGVTVTGTATVAQNTWREYRVLVTATGTPTVVMQNIGAGTN